MKYISLILISLFFLAFYLNTPASQQKESKKYELKISTCIFECKNDSGKILLNQLKNDTLKIKVSHWFNCALDTSNAILGFDITKQRINFKVKQQYESIEFDENGDSIEVYSAADCDCYYELSFKSVGFTRTPNKITINGKSPNNYLGYPF